MAIANNAAWLKRTVDALAARGFKTAYENGWATRTNGGASPDHEAIIVHHTGANTTSTAYLRDGEKGRPMIPPYAQIHVRRDGTLVVIGAGGASHAGYVHQPCWDRIIGQTAPMDRDLIPGSDSKTFSPNRNSIGIEVNGAGGVNDWTAEQRAVVVAFCAEYHKVRGWSGVPKVGAHKELTLRKPGDPWENMGRLRTDIRNQISNPANTQEDIFMALNDADQRRLLEAANRIMGMMVQRYDAKGNPARVLDSEDGNYLRVLAEENAARAGVDIAKIAQRVDAQTATITEAADALKGIAGNLQGDQAAQIQEIASRLEISVRQEGNA